MEIRISDAREDVVDAAVELLCAAMNVLRVSEPKALSNGDVARYVTATAVLTAAEVRDIMAVPTLHG